MRHQVRVKGLNRRLVLESDRARTRELLVVVALSVFMLLPVLAYVWQNVEWIQIGYRIEKLKNQRDHLVEAQHRLRLEKASLENLARIERVGVHQLGLTEPPSSMVVMPEEVPPAQPSESRSARIASARNRHPRAEGANGSDRKAN
jgi:cell division protein FtsL